MREGELMPNILQTTSIIFVLLRNYLNKTSYVLDETCFMQLYQVAHQSLKLEEKIHLFLWI